MNPAASSPEAIFQSLKRRKNKLNDRLREVSLQQRGGTYSAETLGGLDADMPDEFDDIDEELSSEEYEELADRVLDQATASRTVDELRKEIASLERLEEKARKVVQSGQDRKWEELSKILQDRPEMYTSEGVRRKLIIFTEYKDYLQDRIGGVLGKPSAVVAIHGGVHRDKRREVQERFRFDPEVLVLVATDAAGEGVNLQNANLMVNYDLPWNPNRIEQRFGRIHRMAKPKSAISGTSSPRKRERGAVFDRLFEKLEVERQALGGKVFDILGEAFEDTPLRDLLIAAIRYGETPKKRAEMDRIIEACCWPSTSGWTRRRSASSTSPR